MKKESFFITRLKEMLAERESPELVLSLASEYKKLGKIYQAISVLKEGIDKNPEYTPGRLALGRLYIECNMLDDAKREFYEVIKRDPENPFAKNWLKKINKNLQDKDKTIERLNSFLIVLKRYFSKSNQN